MKEENRCRCSAEWEGEWCQTKKNFCSEEKCQNGGLCRPIVGSFQCQCLGNGRFFSGPHCEFVHRPFRRFRIVSLFFASLSVLFLLSLMFLVFTLDLLKSLFGVDPSNVELQRMRRKKRPRVQRFIYLNHSTELIPIPREETTV